ncbi:DnaT-like ssDNA-binding protein [Pelagibius sp.]|uniref:DnaT-like ssDNA-binding protein n=1 Tax=Pelagibius sp. TaxID=1931238 RepID=UPI003BB07C34
MPYGTDQGFTDWLAARGYTLPGDAPSGAVLRQLGSDYVDSTYGPRFRGQPTAGYTQAEAWPRTGATAHGGAIPDDVVPVAVEQASYYAAWQEASSPGSLSAVQSQAGLVKQERVEGAVSVTYQDVQQESTVPYDPLKPDASTPILTKVDGMLKPYLVLADFGVGAWTVGPDI